MLNRLISNLPFNPSLIEELSFYSKRLRRERSVRRLGFILIMLSLLVQLFAAGVPPQKSLAESDNDIIRGGVKNKHDILAAWDNPNTHVADIYRKFGLTRGDIASLPNKPNATIKSNASNFWSVGRNSLTGYTGIEQQYINKEIALKTAGPTVYLRPLRAWDRGGGATVYDAFRGTNTTTGETFWILVDCGNYTQNGPGKLPPPKLEVRKTIVGNSPAVKPGDTIKFRIEYRNRQEDSLAEDVKIIDNLQLDKYSIVNPANLPIDSSGKMEQSLGSLRYTDNGIIFDIVARVKSNLKDGVQICNSVRLAASNAPTVTDSGACTKVRRSAAAQVTTAAATTTPTPVRTNGISVPPSLSKSVSNVTQKLSGQAAINSDVLPGDVIEYNLTTYNGRPTDMSGYQVKDYVGDILDYGDIDRAFLSQQGGSFNDQTKEVVWANQTLKAQQDNVRKFRVKIKDPLPSTNKPSNTSTNFDCKISNEYGNEISMKVQCPVIKSIETLPNTGPGAAVAIIFGIASFSGYFLARNGLISKELFIIKRNYTSGSK